MYAARLYTDHRSGPPGSSMTETRRRLAVKRGVLSGLSLVDRDNRVLAAVKEYSKLISAF